MSRRDLAVITRPDNPPLYNGHSAIGPKDAVSVKGRYLVRQDGSRFFLKGIAFPVSFGPSSYDADGWIAVLDQLRSLQVEINTVRLYDVDCANIDYSAFIQYAASLGIYVMIPLTSTSVVLNRNYPAPDCYTRELFEYGRTCIDSFEQYPNIVAGVVANEVMNSLETWKAAPCIVSYVRDLKQYMTSHNKRKIPLVYATQHDAVTAEVLPSETMRLTMDYLACGDEPAIDIFGINMEAWCSSDQTYERNPTGYYPGIYLDLHQHLENASIPVIFSELGCSRTLFNRDNDLPKGYRDWKQVPVIANEMSDTWSGFCAYAYGSNPIFTMTKEWRWDGQNVLEPNQDLLNFRDALLEIHDFSYEPSKNTEMNPVSCEAATAYAEKICMLKLYEVGEMPSYTSASALPLLGRPYKVSAEKCNLFGILSVTGLVALMSMAVMAIFRIWSKGQRRSNYEELPEPKGGCAS